VRRIGLAEIGPIVHSSKRPVVLVIAPVVDGVDAGAAEVGYRGSRVLGLGCNWIRGIENDVGVKDQIEPRSSRL